LTETISEAMVTPDGSTGSRMLPKRSGTRGMVPSTWLGCSALIEYRAADGSAVSTSATLLDWCGLGLIINSKGARTLIAWDALKLIELGSG
jgi:hypothetical protein